MGSFFQVASWAWLLSFALLPCCQSQVSVPAELDGTGAATKQMLDDMVQYFDGDYEDFPNGRFEELIECFGQLDIPQLPQILQVQDAGWRKFIESYYDEQSDWGKFSGSFRESNISTTQDRFFGDKFDKYEVMEPCNFASNVAYYTGAVRVCKREWKTFNSTVQGLLVRTFTTQAMANAWYHGSQTFGMKLWDLISIAVTLNSIYQLLVANIPSDSRVFRTGVSSCGDETDCPQTPIRTLIETISRLTLAPSFPRTGQFSDDAWYSDLLSTPVPQPNSDDDSTDGCTPFEEQIATIMWTGCTALVPRFVCNSILGQLRSRLCQKVQDFIDNIYIPESEPLLSQVGLPLPPWFGWPLFRRLLGVAIGVLNAVAFHEKVFGINDIYDRRFGPPTAGAISSVVDCLSDWLHGIDESQLGFNGQGDPYPGASVCNGASPQAKWQQLSAETFFEAFVLADDINEAIKKHKEKR